MSFVAASNAALFLRQLARNLISEFIFCENRLQFLSAHLFGISPDRPQHAQQSRSLAVLLRRDILQIIDATIASVAVQMVYLHAIRSRPNPCERNERVTVHAVEMPHDRVLGAADAVGRTPTLAANRRERGTHLMHDAALIGDLHVVNRIEFTCP